MATRKKTVAKKSSTKGTTAKKSTAGKKTTKKSTAAGKRTLIAPKGDKRYVRRNKRGQIKESDDVSRSLSQDRSRKARTKAKKGQGDRGD